VRLTCLYFRTTLTRCTSEQIFNLVKELHSAAVVHGDIEPRNVVRTASLDFLLIDFSESKLHLCNDRDQFDVCLTYSELLHNLTWSQALVLDGRPGARKPRCPELRLIQHELSTRSRSRRHRQRKNDSKVISFGNLAAKRSGFASTACEATSDMEVIF
jgi:serine/threonine protein kinase